MATEAAEVTAAGRGSRAGLAVAAIEVAVATVAAVATASAVTMVAVAKERAVTSVAVETEEVEEVLRVWVAMVVAGSVVVTEVAALAAKAIVAAEVAAPAAKAVVEEVAEGLVAARDSTLRSWYTYRMCTSRPMRSRGQCTNRSKAQEVMAAGVTMVAMAPMAAAMEMVVGMAVGELGAMMVG